MVYYLVPTLLTRLARFALRPIHRRGFLPRKYYVNKAVSALNANRLG